MMDTTRRNLLAIVGIGTGMALTGTAVSADSEEDRTEEQARGSERVNDHIEEVIDRLATEEKVSLLHQYQPSIPSVDLDSFRTGTEALHGVAWLGEATVFPQAIGLGSTWDPGLIERVGSAVGDEVRGKHNASSGTVGLNVWSPTVDPLRDPRWGRNEEGYSEDPLLSGAIATAYTDGLTGDDPNYLKTAPVLKHFIGYNNETDRTTTNAEIPPRLLHDYYLPFFRPPIEAGNAVGVMASYNLLNGRPMTVSPFLNRYVRDWAPDGGSVLNVSDAWAPMNLTEAQDYFESKEKARASALTAGLDSFTEHGSDSSTTTEALLGALDAGYLDEADLDEAVGHVLRVRALLGEFLPPSEDPYADLTADVIGRPAHRELARETARKQTVLLKNDPEVLPISEDDSVAVLGPLSDRLFEDWYSGTMPYRNTPEDGVRDRIGAEQVHTAVGADRIALRERDSGKYVTAGVGKGGGVLGLSDTDAPNVQLFETVQWTETAWTLRATANDRYVTVDGDQLINSSERPAGWEVVQEAFEFVDVDDGVVLRHPSSDRYVAITDGSLHATAEQRSDATRFVRDVRHDGIETAIETASDVDVAVVVVGTHPLMGGRETRDRETLAIAPSQRELLARVADAQSQTVLVIESSYPVRVEEEKRLPSILWTSHAGQETGRAVADVLVGDISPGGRLPQTWPRSVEQLPDITEYNIAETGMTYRYGQANPLYAFGHGLSYSSFEYDDLRVSPRGPLESGATATISVRVTNTGSMAADEVVQFYTTRHQSGTTHPDRVLRGFDRVHLAPGESTTVECAIDHEAFSVWDVTRRKRIVERASHSVLVGAASDDIRLRGSLRVNGERIPPRDLSEETRAVDADDWSWSEVELLDRSRMDGTVVGMTDGSWISFADVDLRHKPTEATVSVARSEPTSATIELRHGSRSGRLFGRTDVPSTGDVYEYTELSIPVSGMTGNRQDLCLVVRGGTVRVNTIRLE